ncbi:MAG: N-acetyltransferase [Niameybacter sp.]|uniref:GNAT family N-acetyltransferase n=1 Tax=Niameybacter sp. TaxID=2033640 RepID=UPI002FCC32A3
MAIIRPEKKAEYEAIYAVHQSAFKRDIEAQLVDRLRTTSYYHPELSLVIEENDEIIGHLLFTRVVIKDGNKTFPALALAPVGIKADHQRKKLGTELIEAGLKKAKYLGHKLIIVLGDPKFYTRFGFERAADFEITPPMGFPEEAFLVAKLSPEETDIKGQVLYPVQFNMTLEK